MYYGLALIRCVWRKQSEISVQVEGRSPRNEREPGRTSSWLIGLAHALSFSLPPLSPSFPHVKTKAVSTCVQ